MIKETIDIQIVHSEGETETDEPLQAIYYLLAFLTEMEKKALITELLINH